jgi:hypothetical protein
MKKSFLILAFLCISVNFFSQGISVQGIARNNDNSAMTGKTLDFTFDIAKADNTVLYSETQTIKTDILGVFSHIVSQGNPQDNASFQNVDFSLENLRLKVTVSLDGNVFEVYNQPFQYTPYAHFAKRAKNADDGVPTGAIMPFIGKAGKVEDAPAGWVFCWGQSITNTEGAAALIDLVGNTAPDLKGMFLRGAGVTTVSKDTERLTYVGPDLMEFQEDADIEHKHYNENLEGSASAAGDHTHNTGLIGITESISNSKSSFKTAVVSAGSSNKIELSLEGKHPHEIKDISGYSGYAEKRLSNREKPLLVEAKKESRPANYGVNYIIKL